MGTGRRPERAGTGREMLGGASLFIAENARQGSVFFGKIDRLHGRPRP